MKDIYLKIGSPDVKGESLDKDHADWLEIDSWVHEIRQPKSSTASSTGGNTAERCEHDAMAFTKTMDVTSPQLYEAASSGTTFKEITIEFFKRDGEGNRVKYLAIDLKNAVVASIAPKVMAGQEPMETFTLKYAAVQWRYTQKASGGGQQGNTQGAWSLTKNDKSFTV
ncbi:type VI secretion system tube protein Hcp [Pseudomonas sp.]|uniref:Hcp family type VI secretion system effector n=1 Tax=Pseudomonas sp. TaxID=306 RepID=UPI00260F1EA1|nr:type VI secretion system tube protein Hcp [Pseudomonas sp.]